MISISFFTLCLQAWAADAATGAFRYTDASTLYDNSSYPTYFQLQAQIKSTFADFAEAFKKIGYSITAIKE